MEYKIKDLKRIVDVKPETEGLIYECIICNEPTLKERFHITNNRDDTDDVESTGEYGCESCGAEFIEDNEVIKLTGYRGD